MIKKFKFIAPLLLFAILILPMVSAVSYNTSILLDERLNATINVDEYTELDHQDISFSINKINTEEKQLTDAEAIEGYANSQPPSEWHATRSSVTAGTVTRIHYECVAETAEVTDKVSFLPHEYSSIYPKVVEGSHQSLYFKHDSYDEYRGDEKPCTAWYNMPQMNIGVVSFDTMVHLNVSNAKFYFGLNALNNASKMVSGYFDLTSSGSDVLTRGYVYPVGETTGSLSTTPTLFYTSTANEFNWLHVDIFFDTWNDLYNISVQQYASDWSFIESQPSSLVVKGNQNDGTNRTNSGARLSASHLLDKLEFSLVSYATNPPQRSEAWVDNVEFKYYEFPAVYADIVYANYTFAIESPEPKQWLNNTIVSSFEAPAYPNDISIEFGSEYLSTKTRPGLLTGWELAPSWQYVVPYFIPIDNKQIVINTILDYFNDEDDPLEQRATLKPRTASAYNDDADLGPFHEMQFVFNSEDSSDTSFYFESTNTELEMYKMKFEYSEDFGYEGWLRWLKSMKKMKENTD